MKRQNTRKKVPPYPSQSDTGLEIEKKVDEILNAHSEVLRRGRERTESSENSLSLSREPQLLFFTKDKNKIKPLKQVITENKPTKKHHQYQQKTQSKNKNSQRNHVEKLDSDLKIREKNVSHLQRNTLNQKITNIAQKILHSSSPPVHQYFTFDQLFYQKRENNVYSAEQVVKEKKRIKLETKEREREARRLVKEYDEKLRLERLAIKRKEEEELLRKKQQEKQAKLEVKEREREAIRVAKEHEEKLRLERIAIEKEQQEEQKRKVLAEKKAIAEAKEKERRLLEERENKVRLERLEAQRKEKEEILRKKQEQRQAEQEVKERELEAKRVAKEYDGKLRLERIAIEKEQREQEKRKVLEAKKAVAEAKEKEQEMTMVKSFGEEKLTKSTPDQRHTQHELRSQLGEELQRARLDRQQGRKDSAYVRKADSELTAVNEEEPLVFEDSIAQVKPDESTWLDEKIKSDKTGDVDTKNTLKKDLSEVFFDDTSLIADLSAKSKFESPGFSPNLKKDTFDEIIPDGKILNNEMANKLKTLTLEHLGYSHNAIEEIDFYSLQEPFAYVEIIREKESLDKRYILIEIGLSEEETRYLAFIKETLEDFSFNTEDLEAKGESEYLTERVDSIINEYMLDIDTLSKEKIMYYLENEAIGLGKLEELMKDPNIEDISCDGSGISIFLYHRRYGSVKSNIMFNDDDELSAFVVKLAQKCGKHISISEPMLDATMPDGSRIQMTLSTEVTTKGSTFTIRKFSQNPFSPPDLIEFHTMSSEMVAYMWLAVENGVNALIAGGTAAGKTSTLNAISLFIPRESKIVSIEETREINLPHPNWIPGVVRSGFGDVVGDKVTGEIDLYDLMKAALRQRPEYILVGEIRGKEAYVLFQAMATGHTTYSTFHADSAESLIHRLEGKPIDIPRIMLQSLDIVTFQVQAEVGNQLVRRCKQIVEIVDIDPISKEILTNEVFHWDPVKDEFYYSGKSYILDRIRSQHGLSKEEMMFELKRRIKVLEWMKNNNIRAFKDVAKMIASYLETPKEIMIKISKESEPIQKVPDIVEMEPMVEKYDNNVRPGGSF